MNSTAYEVIIVGAGYAGLAASYHLKLQGLQHIVFERRNIGESWRSQRWDAFRLNSTNKLNVLPGMVCEEADQDAFEPASSLVSYFEKYVATWQLPVEENSTVVSIEKTDALFNVAVLSNGIIKTYASRQVLIASGCANETKIPSFAGKFSKSIQQLHASEYRNASRLSEGAVLVAGCAQSGIQIAEDLVNAGRKVFVASSKVARIPRWYRGRDIFYWLIDINYFDIKAHQLADRWMLQMRNPQVSGTGTGRDTVSLQWLEKRGAVILGKMYDADGELAIFHPDAAAHVKFADEYSGQTKKAIDEFIIKNNITAPPAHFDDPDLPDAGAACASAITSLHLQENNISSIIWTTGFTADLNYIKLPVFDQENNLIHENGVSLIPGLHFLGFPWLRSRKSTVLFGIKEDAEFVVHNMFSYAGVKKPSTLVMGL